MMHVGRQYISFRKYRFVNFAITTKTAATTMSQVTTGDNRINAGTISIISNS